MAVLALLAGFTALVTVNLDLSGYQTQNQWTRLQTYLQSARARSISTGREVTLSIEPGDELTLETSPASGESDSLVLSDWQLVRPESSADLHFTPVNVSGPDRLVFRSSDDRKRTLRLDRIRTVQEVDADE